MLVPVLAMKSAGIEGFAMKGAGSESFNGPFGNELRPRGPICAEASALDADFVATKTASRRHLIFVIIVVNPLLCYSRMLVSPALNFVFCYSLSI